MGRFLALCMILGACLTAAEKGPTLVKKSRSPINENALVMLLHDQFIKKDEIIEVRTRSFPVGQLSPPYATLAGVQRRDHFCDVLAVIDGKPTFTFTYLDGMPFVESQRYFHYTLEKKLSAVPGISKGPHTVVVILRNSYGESLKVPACVDMMVFSYQVEASRKELEQLTPLLEKPALIYNQPSGNFQKGRPVLVDFYKLGCVLGPTDYQVAIYLNGKLLQKVSAWNPYVLKNMPLGRHTLRLELINASGEVVPNPFGVEVEGSFEVSE